MSNKNIYALLEIAVAEAVEDVQHRHNVSDCRIGVISTNPPITCWVSFKPLAPKEGSKAQRIHVTSGDPGAYELNLAADGHLQAIDKAGEFLRNKCKDASSAEVHYARTGLDGNPMPLLCAESEGDHQFREKVTNP